MEKLPGDYVAGFVDGEGCFALKFRRDVRHDRKNTPVYFYWDIEFAIVLKGDDKSILKQICNTLDCGSVGNISKNGTVRYSVYNINDLAGRVIPFFEKYPLRAKKRLDFELWKEAVRIFKRNQRSDLNIKKGKSGFQRTEWNSHDLKRLQGIHEEMRRYKANVPEWKWINKVS